MITLLALFSILVTFQPGHDGTNLQQAAKSTALLGVLVSLDATLRLVPTFLGASPIFPLIMLTGVVFGSAMGFQMGALTLLVSAFLTGGIGPWLPFQMMVAGWVGLTAGWLPRFERHRVRLAVLATFAAVWGFLYGALMNLWSWPFASPGLEEDAGLYWTPSLSAVESLRHYAQFYLLTSAAYDLFRAAANVAIILILGPPVLATLERFADRFTWQPWVEAGGE
jgi:energy-coupling factor transport system substrate-specific component